MGLYSHRLYNNGPLLHRYTCDGTIPSDIGDVSPDFYWRNLPLGTASLSLMMEDITNSNKITHWIVWNIMSNSELEENDKSKVIGLNDFDIQGYSAPCKDDTTKKIKFTLYALDILSIPELMPQSTRKNDLLEAIEPHILETATLMVYL
jgi:Raf kinase inhibitor-like YbhB/YbcL family protein